MKAMLYADWLNFRQSLRTILYILVVFCFAAFAWSGPTFLSVTMVMLSVLLPVSLCASDQAYGWDKLSLSLPILRHEVVGSKFVIGLLANLTLFALSSVLTAVYYGAVDRTIPLPETIATLVGCETVSLLLMGLMLAIIFRFGVDKSRYILIVVVWGPMLLFAAAVKMQIAPGVVQAIKQGLHQLETQPIGVLSAVVLLAAAAVYALCYAVSVRTFRKKEL